MRWCGGWLAHAAAQMEAPNANGSVTARGGWEGAQMQNVSAKRKAQAEAQAHSVNEVRAISRVVSTSRMTAMAVVAAESECATTGAASTRKVTVGTRMQKR